MHIIKIFNLTINDVTIRIYEYPIDKLKTEDRLREALTVVNRFKRDKKIHVSNFSVQEANVLRASREPMNDKELFANYLRN